MPDIWKWISKGDPLASCRGGLGLGDGQRAWPCFFVELNKTRRGRVVQGLVSVHGTWYATCFALLGGSSRLGLVRFACSFLLIVWFLLLAH